MKHRISEKQLREIMINMPITVEYPNEMVEHHYDEEFKRKLLERCRREYKRQCAISRCRYILVTVTIVVVFSFTPPAKAIGRWIVSCVVKEGAQHTDIYSYSVTGDASESELKPLEVNYVPGGFKLTEHFNDNGWEGYSYEKRGEKGTIYLNVDRFLISNNMESAWNIEGDKEESIVLRGQNVKIYYQYVECNNATKVWVQWSENMYEYSVSMNYYNYALDDKDIDIEEIIKVAESLD